jgi:diaminohydroxyphosphoribosylaminopyrimidine deaminase/5-amino-6-(5-phosphoribosylamino)uracil reductase
VPFEPDPRHMREAVAEALKGEGITHPNPSVGAVVVRDGRVVGRGYHRGPGTPHAEVVALREAGELARGADLYVTLEPCNVFGRTPPCTAGILEAGIARVAASVKDPNPQVDGAGAEELRRAGLEVVLGFLAEEGAAADRAYHASFALRRPFVHLKIAQSLDGCVTAPRGGYLTGEEARRAVHRDRFRSDALLVSASTVLADDPRLTVRLPDAAKVLPRVVLDSRCALTGRERLLREAPKEGPVWVFRPPGSPAADGPGEVETLTAARAEGGGLSLADVFRTLGDRRVVAVYAEAVGRLAGALLAEGWVDRLSLHLSPSILGDGEGARPAVSPALARSGGLRLSEARWSRAGSDWIVETDLEGRCLRD